MAESKSRQRFVELAEKRVSRAIKDIRMIGKLANRSNYTYSDEDVRKITRALRKELKDLESRFSGDKGQEEPVFRL